MIEGLVLEAKVFLFIMAMFVVFMSLVHVLAVLSLKKGRLATENGLIAFGVSVSYIITMLICGF